MPTMSSSANTWVFVGAALVGLVTAIGALIVQEKRRHTMAQELNRIDGQLARLKSQMQELQASKEVVEPVRRPRRSRRQRQNSNSTTVTTTTDDFNSALDSSDLEFYDLSDEDVSRASTITPFDALVKDIDIKLDSGIEKELKISQLNIDDMCMEYPDNASLYWRKAKCLHKLSSITVSPPHKKELIYAGIQAAEEAVKLNSSSGEAHKWYAILVGSRSLFQGSKEKIADGFTFRQHLNLALEQLPDDPTLHHLLGQFAFEISSLKWYERKAAAALYSALPTLSFQDAIKHLMDAERLSKEPWKENKLMVGKCHVAMGDIREGVRWIQQADEISTENGLHNPVDTEVKTLLQKYNAYCQCAPISSNM